MPKTLTIVTGASRGLGYALAEESIGAGDSIVTVQRTEPQNLPKLAAKSHCSFKWVKADMADLASLSPALTHALKEIDLTTFDRLFLINNAGKVNPIGPIDIFYAADLVDIMNVNYCAVVLLTQAFLFATKQLSSDRRILNISSGAGRRSVVGWAMYSSTKAAVDRFSASVALDEKRKTHPVRIASVAPGVVDTDMQGSLRDTDENIFPDRERYLVLKAEEKLQNPKETAKKLLNYLKSEDFGLEPIADIRTLNL